VFHFDGAQLSEEDLVHELAEEEGEHEGLEVDDCHAGVGLGQVDD